MHVIKYRRGTAARWSEVNPILRAGEPAVETDTGRFKIGDGLTPWTELPAYLNEEAVLAAIDAAELGSSPEPGEAAPQNIAEHVNDPTPHPVYDDGPSLLLLYLNAKV